MKQRISFKVLALSVLCLTSSTIAQQVVNVKQSMTQTNNQYVADNEVDLRGIDSIFEKESNFKTDEDSEESLGQEQPKIVQWDDDSQFQIDHSKPIKDSVFFMEDDFYHDIPLAKDAPSEPVETSQVRNEDEQIEQIDQSDSEEQDKVQDHEEVYNELGENEDVVEHDRNAYWSSMNQNQSDPKKEQIYKNTQKNSYSMVDRMDHKRPIYGVLTEPIRGDMEKKIETDNTQTEQIDENILIKQRDLVSYIPKAHVQFLEQSGIRVVPISYLDSAEEIISLLDQVNGIYIPGDSHKSISNSKYHDSFSVCFNYVKDKYDTNNDYFPMFAMGKSAQMIASQVAINKSILKDMKSWSNRNVQVRLLNNHVDTFLLHKLSNDTSIAAAFSMGQFFNKQSSGIKLRDFNGDNKISGMFNIVATFKDSGFAEHNITMGEQKNATDVAHDGRHEFVAIAEGKKYPIYIVTYNIEMTQFIYTDLMVTDDTYEVLDKSIPARHHAQFLSQQIADEGRLNTHQFHVTEKQYTKLIRHHKLVSVEYTQASSKQETAFPMPKGLEKHDIYIIKQNE